MVLGERDIAQALPLPPSQGITIGFWHYRVYGTQRSGSESLQEKAAGCSCPLVVSIRHLPCHPHSQPDPAPSLGASLPTWDRRGN